MFGWSHGLLAQLPQRLETCALCRVIRFSRRWPADSGAVGRWWQQEWDVLLELGNFWRQPLVKVCKTIVTSQFIMGKLTISMANFDSFVIHYQRVKKGMGWWTNSIWGREKILIFIMGIAESRPVVEALWMKAAGCHSEAVFANTSITIKVPGDGGLGDWRWFNYVSIWKPSKNI